MTDGTDSLEFPRFLMVCVSPDAIQLRTFPERDSSFVGRSMRSQSTAPPTITATITWL